MVQRVTRAQVSVDSEIVGSINHGLVVLLGVGKHDDESAVRYLARKVVGLRVFEDDAGQMNLAVTDVGGALLVVSQFTLYGDCRRGRRPSFIEAMVPEQAEPLCERFVALCREQGVTVATGRFRAMMQLELCNSGPVTILFDSQRTF